MCVCVCSSAMLTPEGRGHFVFGFVGALFTVDNFAYAFWPWFFLHVTVEWMATGANQLPALEMAEFLMADAFVFAFGAFCGLALAYAMRIRELVPTHTTQDRHPKLGIVLATYGVIVGVRGSVITSGAPNVHAPFFDTSDTISLVGYVTAAVAGFLLFASVLYLTWWRQRPIVKERDFWSWFTLTYRDNLDNVLAADYVMAAVLLLSPQSAWNYFVRPPTSMPQAQAGAITIAIEVAVWVGLYFWFTRVRNVEKTHFAWKESYAPFWMFVLAAGGTQFSAGISYLISAEIPEMSDFVNGRAETFFAIFIIPSLVLSVGLFCLLGVWRKKEKRRRRRRWEKG